MEYLNTLWDDHMQVNDILTIRDPSTMIQSACLFYKGYLVCNRCDSNSLNYISKMNTIYKIHDKYQ